MSDTFKPPQQGEKKKGRGCLYGCLGAVVAVVVLIAVVIFALGAWLKGTVEDYTDTEPLALQTPALTQAETEALDERVTSFLTLARETTDSGSIELHLHEAALREHLQDPPERSNLHANAFGELRGRHLEGHVAAVGPRLVLLRHHRQRVHHTVRQLLEGKM